MCSIAGVVGKGDVQKMIAIQRHRAPDGERFFVNDEIQLGMGRLKILDLRDEGLCLLELGNFKMAWNGEIYNGQELRAELIKLGHSFLYENDGEVVLHAYQQWGKDCLDKLNGMFAIAIYDEEKHQVFLARDRAGEKPLYCHWSEKQFIFSSELKAIWGIKNLGAIRSNELDTLEHCIEETGIVGVAQLKAGHCAVFDIKSKNLTIEEWWRPKPFLFTAPDDLTATERQVEEVLEHAIKLRMRADVPVGLYLSGGIDSALIAYYGRPTHAYTVSFKDDQERKIATQLAKDLDIKHSLIQPNEEDFIKDRHRFVFHLDTPVGSFSTFPLWCLAKRASEDVKVVLSGEGSDELFGGYARYLMPILAENALKVPFLKEYGALVSKYLGTRLDQYDRFTSRGESVKKYAKQIKTTDFGFWDFKLILPSLLQMGDRMASAFGMENRCPFLDKDLIDLAYSLPEEYKYGKKTPKYILRRIAEKRLPKYVTAWREKKGLTFPVVDWVGTDGHAWDRKKYLALIIDEWTKIYTN